MISLDFQRLVKRRAERLCRPALSLFGGRYFVGGYCASRYIKVTIWAQVQGAAGLKLLLLVPEVMPSDTAHATASA